MVLVPQEFLEIKIKPHFVVEWINGPTIYRAIA
jgi:hypothetical protein